MQEEINNININMTKLNKDIGFIKESLTENKEDHEKMMNIIDDWIKASEHKFAGRWVEKALIWTGVTIGGVLIVAVMNLIIK